MVDSHKMHMHYIHHYEGHWKLVASKSWDTISWLQHFTGTRSKYIGSFSDHSNFRVMVF